MLWLFDIVTCYITNIYVHVDNSYSSVLLTNGPTCTSVRTVTFDQTGNVYGACQVHTPTCQHRYTYKRAFRYISDLVVPQTIESLSISGTQVIIQHTDDTSYTIIKIYQK